MSDITPEVIANALEDADSAHIEGAVLGVIAVGSTLRIRAIPLDGDEENAKRFRAVVVEGDGPVVVASAEFLAAARALYRAHVAASTLPPESAACTVYELQEALEALTPEQVAVLAGDDPEASQAEQERQS